MINLKKKIGALLPGEAARSQLQNVLTVEWSGHKTVLVEVPSLKSPSNEVEMLGMSSSNEYGRLLDRDDEGDSGAEYFVRPRIERHSSSGVSAASMRAKSLPPLPGDIAISSIPLSHHSSEQNDNPFANPFSHEDDFATAQSVFPGSEDRLGSPFSSQRVPRQMPPPPPSRPGPPPPRAPHDHHGRVIESPISSSGSSSRGSSAAAKSDEDPFR